MAKKPLKSHLNQIRAWAREGRTDAWIAHQLDVPASELQGFRKRHGLTAGEEGGVEEDDLRDTIEAEIEAATLADLEAADEDEDEDDEDTGELEVEADAQDGEEEPAEAEREDDRAADEGGAQRRGRRRRRRRGGARRPGVGMEASFDHGAEEGYGLWLDPAVADDPIYEEHWRGHSAVTVTVEPDRIVITRSE